MFADELLTMKAGYNISWNDLSGKVSNRMYTYFGIGLHEKI